SAVRFVSGTWPREKSSANSTDRQKVDRQVLLTHRIANISHAADETTPSTSGTWPPRRSVSHRVSLEEKSPPVCFPTASPCFPTVDTSRSTGATPSIRGSASGTSPGGV